MTVATSGGGGTTSTPASPQDWVSGGGAHLLTSDQQSFAARLAADTGLNLNVIAAWLLAEESGGAAQSRQAANNNDWLNIGYTDTATYGASDPQWSNPTTAADTTAAWLKGQNVVPGYGTASPGIQSILKTAGQPPSAQIAALQGSGWASSGYPALGADYNMVTGAGGLSGGGASGTPGGDTGLLGTGIGPNFGPDLFGSQGSLNPASWVSTLWSDVTGSAKYAFVFLGVLAVAVYMITRGFSHATGGGQGGGTRLVPVPV
jgi:hypothetical protein